MTKFARLIPERLRWAHRWYALNNGYFWSSCVLCGRKFGGHEWRDIGGKPSRVPDPTRDPGAGVGICPACTRSGRGARP